MKPRWWLAMFLLLALVSGCAKQASPPVETMVVKGEAEAPPMVGVAPLGLPAEEGARDSLKSVGGEDTQRLVVRTAYLSVVVADPESVMNDLARLAEDMGGFVVSSGLSTMRLASGAEVPRATITFRVPAERFQEALDQVRAKASRVDEERISGEDVTEEYVDLQARLRNLRAAEAQLQEIMDQATRTEDVLQVYRELTNIRGEIERLEGRIRYLEQSAAMSAITVDLIPDEAAQPLRVGGWEPKGVAKGAVEALIHTLQGLASLLIWLVIYVAPVLLVLGVVFVLPVYTLVRWWRRRKRRASS